jgi:hypothetical protein
VKTQLQGTIPVGEDTDAGWLLKWRNPSAGQLSQVIVPWTLLGQYPNNPTPLGYRYNGGQVLPQSTIGNITDVVIKTESHGDPYFAAVLDVRASIKNPQWVIFTTTPYLPITDSAYGFATVVNKEWKIVDFGTARVGCSEVPNEVEAEFGFSCP